MKYRDAFDAIIYGGRPRRDDPARGHWLWRVYMAGERVGYMLARTPVRVWWRGLRSGIEEG